MCRFHKRLVCVTIQSANDPRVMDGVLLVAAGGNIRVDVVENIGQPALAGGYRVQTIELSVGTFQVQVAG